MIRLAKAKAASPPYKCNVNSRSHIPGSIILTFFTVNAHNCGHFAAGVVTVKCCKTKVFDICCFCCLTAGGAWCSVADAETTSNVDDASVCCVLILLHYNDNVRFAKRRAVNRCVVIGRFNHLCYLLTYSEAAVWAKLSKSVDRWQRHVKSCGRLAQLDITGKQVPHVWSHGRKCMPRDISACPSHKELEVTTVYLCLYQCSDIMTSLCCWTSSVELYADLLQTAGVVSTTVAEDLYFGSGSKVQCKSSFPAPLPLNCTF